MSDDAGVIQSEPAGSPALSGGLFPMRFLGFGLFLAWGGTISQFEQSIDIASLSSPVLRFAIGSVLTALALLGIAAYVHATGRDPWSTRQVVVAGALAALFPAADLAAMATGAFALDLGALACKAAATAVLFLMWTRRLSAEPPRVAWVAFAGSMILSTAAFVLVMALGHAAVVVAVFALPLASCALLQISDRLPAEGEPPASERNAVVWRLPWRLMVLFAAFAFAQTAIGHYDGSVLNAYEWGRLIPAAIAIVPILVAFDRFNPEMIVTLCPALFIAAFALCGVHGMTDDLGLRKLLSSTGYYALEMYFYFSLGALSYRYGIRSEWLFGTVWAASMLAAPLGAALGDELLALDGAGDFAMVDLAMGAIATALVLTGSVLLARTSPDDAWGVKGVRLSPGDAVAGQGAEGSSAVRTTPATSDYLRDRVRQCSTVARHFGLTHREEEVLSLMVEGHSFQQIESELSIAHPTLRTHVQHIYAKLGVHSGDEARAFVVGWRG
jgi:DNA-binding CsgD family transcriptional regulator